MAVDGKERKLAKAGGKKKVHLLGAITHVTADAMQATRENARWLTEDKHARYLVPVLGNQPGLYAAPGALGWERTPPSLPRPARSAAAGSRPAPSGSFQRPIGTNDLDP